jgi:hypothetical protein
MTDPIQPTYRREEVEPEKIAVPAPEVPARPARPEEIPGGARTVLKRLEKHGWTTEALYARGPWVDNAMTPDMITMWEVDSAGQAEPATIVAVTASILVRGRRGRQQVAALWVLRPGLKDATFKFHFAYTKPTPAGATTGRIDSKQLKQLTESEAS